MKLEVSVDGKKWTPLDDFDELGGFIQGVDGLSFGIWEVKVRKAKK